MSTRLQGQLTLYILPNRRVDRHLSSRSVPADIDDSSNVANSALYLGGDLRRRSESANTRPKAPNRRLASRLRRSDTSTPRPHGGV
jgi:hypothetical protein